MMMNSEDIIRMAQEAGCPVAGIGPMTFDDKQLVSMLERFAALVASAVREEDRENALAYMRMLHDSFLLSSHQGQLKNRGQE
jgi:hypothetical protein